MRPDGPVKDLTPQQKLMARTAGVPADRPGLGGEYPKMIYRPGKNDRHCLMSEPLKIAGKFECETAFVDSPEDEAQAMAEGWFLTPDPAEQAAVIEKRKADTAKDDEIAALRAQLAAKDQKAPPKAAAQ